MSSSPAIIISETIKIFNVLKPYIPRLRRFRLTKKRMGIIKTVVVFGAGFYAGVYASQNYDLPRFDDPNTLSEKVLTQINTFLEQYRKK